MSCSGELPNLWRGLREPLIFSLLSRDMSSFCTTFLARISRGRVSCGNETLVDSDANSGSWYQNWIIGCIVNVWEWVLQKTSCKERTWDLGIILISCFHSVLGCYNENAIDYVTLTMIVYFLWLWRLIPRISKSKSPMFCRGPQPGPYFIMFSHGRQGKELLKVSFIRTILWWLPTPDLITSQRPVS